MIVHYIIILIYYYYNITILHIIIIILLRRGNDGVESATVDGGGVLVGRCRDAALPRRRGVVW